MSDPTHPETTSLTDPEEVSAGRKVLPAFLSDDEAARIFAEVERTRKQPAAEIMKRLPAEWPDLVNKAQEGKGVDRVLKRVEKSNPDRVGELRSKMEAARKAARDEDEAGDDPEEDGVVDRRPVLDETALYGLAGEIVMAADPHTESDKAAVLVQLLAGFANAVGRGPYWVAGATRHYLSIFVALVGVTAFGRKGSSWDVAEYFLSRMDEEWGEQRVRTGMSSGEGLIFHIRDRVTHFDESGEEVEDDPGVRDKRLFLIEPELSRAFKVMNKESSTLSDTLRSAWDCPRKLATLTKHSPNTASDALLSVVGHITKSDVGSLLSKADSLNGTGNRFLWVFTTRSKELPFGGDFFEHEEDWLPLIGRMQAAREAAQKVGRMNFDEDAKVIWEERYRDLSGARPGTLGAMLGRAIPYVRRVACIYALLDGLAIVEARHLHAAFSLWKYVEDSARFVFGDSLGDPRAEKLLAALKAAPEGLSQSEISKLFSNNLKKPVLEKLLSDLLELDLIHRGIRTGGKGRPATDWFAGGACRARTK